jgi:hypothetical protein
MVEDQVGSGVCYGWVVAELGENKLSDLVRVLDSDMDNEVLSAT